MKIEFTPEAWQDFEWFLDKDKQIVKRIREILKDILRHSEEGEVVPIVRTDGSTLLAFPSPYQVAFKNSCE